MKKFQFSLQRVLEYDTHLQKNEAEVLAALQGEYAALANRKEAMQLAYDHGILRYQSDMTSGQSASHAAVTGRYIKDQRQSIIKITEQMLELTHRIDQQREKLLSITKDKTMIEKLKSHAREKYQSAERKSDELFIEEFISNQSAKADSR